MKKREQSTPDYQGDIQADQTSEGEKPEAIAEDREIFSYKIEERLRKLMQTDDLLWIEYRKLKSEFDNFKPEYTSRRMPVIGNTNNLSEKRHGTRTDYYYTNDSSHSFYIGSEEDQPHLHPPLPPNGKYLRQEDFNRRLAMVANMGRIYEENIEKQIQSLEGPKLDEVTKLI